MQGALILTAAAIFIKILSAFYRVPFQNIVGDTGFYIYQQIYPLYGIALALSTYGFPVVISKLVAEAQGNENDLQRVAGTSFYVLSAVGLIFFSFLYTGSGKLAAIMGDKQLEALVKVISFSFLIMPFVAFTRGLFQGQGDMVPTAISQVAEQLVRVAAILLFSFSLIEMGASLYKVGSGAVFGSILGAAAAALVIYFFRRRRENKIRLVWPLWTFDSKIASRLIFQGAAVCLSGMMMVIFQLSDSLSLYNGLLHSGLAESEAKIEKGVYDRGQPLLQLGTVVATSISLALVPLITSSYEANNKKVLRRYCEASLKAGGSIGMAATFGLIVIMNPVNTMLFENNKGSIVLSVFALSILLSSIILTISAILQGLGHEFSPAYAVLIGALAKYAGNVWLVPLYGSLGASMSTVLALCLITIILFVSLKKKVRIRIWSGSLTIKISGATAGMAGIVSIWLAFVNRWMPFFEAHRLQMTFQALTGAAIGGIVFGYLILKLKIFKEDELLLFPFGEKLLSLTKKIP